MVTQQATQYGQMATRWLLSKPFSVVGWLLSGHSASHSVWSGGYSVVTQQATQYGQVATQW